MNKKVYYGFLYTLIVMGGMNIAYVVNDIRARAFDWVTVLGIIGATLCLSVAYFRYYKRKDILIKE
jgi:hypothetical protein